MLDKIDFLWRSYKDNGDISSRNKLVLHYYSFVKNIVRKIYYTLPKTVDISDIENYAHIGLMDAIKKFNLEKNIKFETYANFRIRGAIFDGIRKQDWLPKTLRSKMKKIEREESKNGNGVDSDTINDGSQSKIGKKDIENYTLLSLDRINYYQDGSAPGFSNSFDNGEESDISSPDFVEKVENKIFVREIISGLDFKERKIIYLYYFRGKTFKEIGKIMNVTESRVSQIHKKALLTLKRSLLSTRAGKMR
jgi:RNA polymerase sigma factor FliA